MFRATGLVCLFFKETFIYRLFKKEGMSFPSFLLSLNIERFDV